MFNKTEKWARVLIVMVLITFAVPVISIGAGDTGRDWYCSEPDHHTIAYQKHLKNHINRGAEAIANSLEKIYSDPSLTTEEKKAKTVAVLDKYLAKVKVGEGD